MTIHEAIRIIGDRWSPKTHEVKDFLARNRMPYRWLDIESDNDALQLIAQAGLTDRRLPVLLFPDGSYLVQPTDEAIAEKIGFSTTAESRFYDLIIVGGGPAGWPQQFMAPQRGFGRSLSNGRLPVVRPE
jgi:thioredoxin reductase (NADPH)